MHKDNYENVYVQVVGLKHFVLLPPVEMPCANERVVPQYRYVPVVREAGGDGEGDGELAIEAQQDSESIPVAIWDPEVPDERMSEYSHLSRALHVTLQEGDMLYLPAMWYHKVKQTSGPEGFACAVNYWYDMSFEGSFWASNSFVRDVALARGRGVRYPDLELGKGE